MKYLSLLIAIGFATTAFSQNKKKEDVAAINSMCGCYEITFNFAETFAPDKDYEFHENYKSGALEYVFPISQSKDKIVLQHLLVINDTMIIKHWRQDWLYENTDLYSYHKDNTWKYTSLPENQVKGQWTQKVYQVDDSPRYEGSATWIHADGRHYWENTTDAPLPRRERTKRSDYNVMERRNRQEITDFGWVHEQDNAKVIRGEKDQILAYEKGWNTYTKVDNGQCDPAKKWWAENDSYWSNVRIVWDEIFSQKKNLSLEMKVDDKILFQRLFALGDELPGSKQTPEETQKEIREIIELHTRKSTDLAIK